MFCAFRNYLRAKLQNQKFASWPPSNNVPSWFSSLPIPQLGHQFGLNLLQCDRSVNTNNYLDLLARRTEINQKVFNQKKTIYSIVSAG